MGSIPNDQIIGWFTVTKDVKKQVLETINSLGGAEPAANTPHFTPNEKYVKVKEKYASGTPSGARYDLAGFPDHHEVWKSDTADFWKPYQTKPAAETLADFIEGELGDHAYAAKIRSPKTAPPPLPPLPWCKRDGKGCGKDPKTKNPRPTEEKVGSSEAELVEIAERNSKEQFDGFLREYGHEPVAKFQGELHPELNGRLGKFREVPRVDKIRGIASKVGHGALGAGGLALYGAQVVEALTSDASVLDKAAVVTSIIPFIGCTVQAADDAQRGGLDAAHTTLCYAEDALTVIGLWEVAVVLQVFESAVNVIKAIDEQEKLYDGVVFRKKRIEGWNNKVDDVDKLVASDDFVKNVTSRFASYQVGVLFQASQLVGDVYAAHAHQLASAGGNSSASRVANASLAGGAGPNISLAVKEETGRQVCAETARNKLRVQMAVEAQIMDAVKTLAERYDDHFFDVYWKEATEAPKLLGFIPIPPTDFEKKQLKEHMDQQRSEVHLPLYESRIKEAVRKAVERVPTPEACLCAASDDSTCEFLHCDSPGAEVGRVDAAGRTFVASLQSGSEGHVSEQCRNKFAPCVNPLKEGETFVGVDFAPRQMWCKNGTTTKPDEKSDSKLQECVSCLARLANTFILNGLLT